ncbi:hypothetical protein BV22DRAFT_836746 [Leucogyrophana mollusca]|uniref:Uncharacterized protein n=1 Tax=Leucogyrophana mollusca TaxID=85980 RepID=A0ACB8B2N7_9AGAM|nr:hypothetical protein BV22DRAFT_836746 [Leucogyrophana mollusca]
MSTTMSQFALVSALNMIQRTRICQFVPCVIVVYDHLLTLDGEVEYIWTKPFSFATILYLLVRTRVLSILQCSLTLRIVKVRYVGDAMTILNAAAFLDLSPSPEVLSPNLIRIILHQCAHVRPELFPPSLAPLSTRRL